MEGGTIMLQVIKPERVTVIRDPVRGEFIIQLSYVNDDPKLHLCVAKDIDDACDLVKGAMLDGILGSGPKRMGASMKMGDTTNA